MAGLPLSVALVASLTATGCGKRHDADDRGERSNTRRVEPYPASPFLNARPDVAYVGDAACEQCHASVVESYRAHGMARTFARADSATVIGDWSGLSIHHAPLNYTYTMSERDGRRFVRETRADSTGRTIHDVEKEVAFVIGSGDNDQGFGYEEAGGLYVLPVEWYRTKGVWDMAPGFEGPRQERWKRGLLPGCIGCHASYPDYVADSGNRYRAPLPVGVGCERCHGPGALHVDAHRAVARGARGAVDSTIVNPAHLSRARQIDVCAQCHLQADVRKPRAGRSEFDFRPGLPLDAFKEMYVPAVEETLSFGFVRHVERMVRSRCFVESDSMTCTTCHDPHATSHGRTAAHWRERCLACHATSDCPDCARDANPNCVACHMRRSQPYDVRHVAITDHWIRRRVEPPATIEETRTRAQEGAPLAHFSTEAAISPAAAAETTAAALAGLGIAHVAIGQESRALPMLERALELGAPDIALSEIFLQRAIARAHAGRREDAIRDLDEAGRLGTESAEAAFRLGQTNLEAGRPRAAAEAFRSGIARFDGDALAWANLAMALAQFDSLEAALDAARRAVSLHAESDEAQRVLGIVLVALGRHAEAEPALREALGLSPDDADAWLALGAAAAAGGRRDEANGAWREAARILPRSPEPWRRIAQDAAAAGNDEAALAAEWEVVRRDQADPSAWTALGDLLGRAGRFREAIVALRHATALDPRAVAAWGNMALAHTELGETETARALLDTVLAIEPNSPKARALRGRIEEMEARKAAPSN